MTVFVCAADERSFAAAAEIFDISPNMVGKHIRFLEERVGARLLNRTTRSQSLTEIGQIYYQRCRQLIADAAAADDCVNAMQASPKGLLKLHAPVSFGSLRLAPALAEFLDAHPLIDVDLALNDRAVDLVAEGFEAAIRIGPLSDSGLVARALKPYTMWVCASPSYLARRGSPSTARHLEDHDCLGFSYWQKKNVWRLARGGDVESIEVRSRFTVNNGQALRTAAIAGMGIVMQPAILVEQDVADGRLVRLLPDYDAPSRPMHIVYLPDRAATPKMKSLVDFVVQSFG